MIVFRIDKWIISIAQLYNLMMAFHWHNLKFIGICNLLASIRRCHSCFVEFQYSFGCMHRLSGNVNVHFMRCHQSWASWMFSSRFDNLLIFRRIIQDNKNNPFFIEHTESMQCRCLHCVSPLPISRIPSDESWHSRINVSREIDAQNCCI